MQHKFLRLPAVKEITGKAKSTIYKDIRMGIFPKPHSIGAKSVAWLESDIQKWIEGRISQSANDNNAIQDNVR